MASMAEMGKPAPHGEFKRREQGTAKRDAGQRECTGSTGSNHPIARDGYLECIGGLTSIVNKNEPAIWLAVRDVLAIRSSEGDHLARRLGSQSDGLPLCGGSHKSLRSMSVIAM